MFGKPWTVIAVRHLAVGLLVMIGFAVPRLVRAEERVLNNLVTELLKVSQPQATPQARHTFTNPRDGWVFISSTASTPKGASVYLILDSENKDEAVTVHRNGEEELREAMRHLPAGAHALNVHVEAGATLRRLVVRAIPEIVYPGLGYGSIRGISRHTPYVWDYLKRIGLADNVNVLLERNPDPALDVAEWRKQGKKILTAEWTHGLIQQRNESGQPFTADWAYEFLAGTKGFKEPDRDGILMSEFDGYGSQEKEYPALTEGVRRLFQKPEFKARVYYPYTVVLYRTKASRAFVNELIRAGSKIAEERYFSEMPTEAEARATLKSDLTYVMREYQKAIPDLQKHMFWTLSYMSAPPETQNRDPGVNFKVFLDMQFNLIANDPVFAGNYGIMCYHSAYADEEILRWSVKLFRHYCIEGRKEMLSTDPYELRHMQNPDFANGPAGWTLSPAEEGSMAGRSMEGYGRLQGRYRGHSPEVKGQGDHFLWTKRSAKGPNRFSQRVKKLEPGRLYSLKIFTADYQHLTQGQSVNEKHAAAVEMDNVEFEREKTLEQTYGSIVGHGKFTPQNPLWSTYRNFVFRARGEEATLTISDWASDTDPGGPIGQELIFNFIEVQPYLEEPTVGVAAKSVEAPTQQRPGGEAGKPTTSDPAPVARYTFDEGSGNVARNAIGDGKDGAINGATHVKAGKGCALSFDGNDDYVTVTDSSTVNLAGDNLSVECWFKVGDPEATWRGLCGNYHSGTAGYMLVYTGSVAFYNGLGAAAASGSTSVSDGKWHHAVGVLDKGTMRLYVDGAKEPRVASEQMVKPSTYPFEIGRYGFGKSFAGEIDDVTVYDKALSAGEIKKRYERGAGR